MSPRAQLVKLSAQTTVVIHVEQAVGGRPPRYTPPLFSFRGRRSALRRRADGNVAAVLTVNKFPRPPLQPPDAPTRRCAKRPGDLDL